MGIRKATQMDGKKQCSAELDYSTLLLYKVLMVLHHM